MRIVATGPEHSGTGLIADIMTEWGVDVLHRAMPHVDEHGCEEWWRVAHYPADLYVHIHRDMDIYYHARKTRNGRADGVERARAAMELLDHELPIDNTHFIWYTWLVHEPERVLRELAGRIGVDYKPYSKEIYDGDAKYK
jgi:hypothetical protein